MRFRNPRNGREAVSVDDFISTCLISERTCFSCPVSLRNNTEAEPCGEYIQGRPLKAAQMLGLEIIPENSEELEALEQFYYEEKRREEEVAADIYVGGNEGGKDNNVPARGEDVVKHPSHYTQGGIECIDALTAMITPYEDPNDAALSWQVGKYIWSHPFKKKPLEDLKKARYYLDRLIRLYEEKETGDAE